MAQVHVKEGLPCSVSLPSSYLGGIPCGTSVGCTSPHFGTSSHVDCGREWKCSKRPFLDEESEQGFVSRSGVFRKGTISYGIIDFVDAAPQMQDIRLYTKDIDAIKEFASEQQSAVGGFPGPCLVLFNGSPSEAKDAFEAGASAVVLPASSVDTAASFDGEIIWRVETAEDVQSVIKKTAESANVFLVDADEASRTTVVESIPSKALCIVVLNAMQLDGKEIDIAKQCKTQGCGSIMVRNACMGDTEDLEYAQFFVGGVTSKASSEFKFSGLTGSTNGHFGGIQSNSSVKWRRSSL